MSSTSQRRPPASASEYDLTVMIQIFRRRAWGFGRATVGPGLYWREIRPPQRGLPRLELRELWAYRDLALILALRDLQLLYRQTLLGVTWVVVQPLTAMLIFALVFGRLANLPSDGVPYTSFALAGLT